MTVTLDIPLEMAVVLRAKAELHGLALQDYLFSLIEVDIDDYYSLSVEEIASVKQGLAELEAGERGMLLEDFQAEMMVRRAARLQQQTVEVAA